MRVGHNVLCPYGGKRRERGGDVGGIGMADWDGLKSAPTRGGAAFVLSLSLTGWRAGSIQIGRESMERLRQDLREGR